LQGRFLGPGPRIGETVNERPPGFPQNFGGLLQGGLIRNPLEAAVQPSQGLAEAVTLFLRVELLIRKKPAQSPEADIGDLQELTSGHGNIQVITQAAAPGADYGLLTGFHFPLYTFGLNNLILSSLAADAHMKRDGGQIHFRRPDPVPKPGAL